MVPHLLAQGPYYVQAVSVGPFGHSPVEALSRCDPTPAPPTAAPAVPAGLAGAAGPRCPPPANAPRLEQPPADDPAAGLAPRAAPEGGAASSSAGSRAPAHAERAPAPLGLQRELSGASEIHRKVRWTVHAKTLTANDKDIVSQPFELNVGVEGPVNFKLGLYPRVSSDARGGASFRRAKGKGRVTLMCTDPRTQTKLQFRIAVGSESSEGQQPRGPVTHDFFEKRVAELPTGSDEWDFKKVVDASTDTFTVCLEILPASG
ncbi:unnamed protein product [Prorocentrum cordatum]|uniref:Uncharacterized protein n=1 Tax=Prorocentrum cordatum TaxID=2364126 RepID=A0ABN9W537_9DINO|nr:unnamed protein product [Polarella glacialis]